MRSHQGGQVRGGHGSLHGVGKCGGGAGACGEREQRGDEDGLHDLWFCLRTAARIGVQVSEGAKEGRGGAARGCAFCAHESVHSPHSHPRRRMLSNMNPQHQCATKLPMRGQFGRRRWWEEVQAGTTRHPCRAGQQAWTYLGVRGGGKWMKTGRIQRGSRGALPLRTLSALGGASPT